MNIIKDIFDGVNEPYDNIKINKEKLTTEGAKIQNLFMYEVGEDRNGDKSYLIDFNNVNKVIKELTIIRISDDERKNIMDDLKPLYSKNKDFVTKLYGKDLNKEMGYNLSISDFNSNMYPNNKNIIFATPAGWYSSKAQIIRHNLLSMIIPTISKYLDIDFLVEGKNNSDYYIFIINKHGIIYDLIFDVTHDSDSFSLMISKWDLVESLGYEIGKSVKKVEFDITDKLSWHLITGNIDREKEVFNFWKNRIELLKNNNLLNYLGIESYKEDYNDISELHNIMFHENLLNTKGKVFFKIHSEKLEKHSSGKAKGLYYDTEGYTKTFNALIKNKK